MKKYSLLIVGIALALVLQGCASKDVTEGMTHEEIIMDAITNTYSAESVEIESEIIYKTDNPFQPIDAEITGNTKVFSEPFLIENNYFVDNRTVNFQEEIKTYVHVIEDQLMGYVLQDNEWIRAEGLIDPDQIQTNPLNNLFLFINHPSPQNFLMVDEEDNDIENTQKFVLSASSEIYEVVFFQGLVSLDISPYVMSLEALEAIGDFELVVWVDKGTLMIEKMELDFTRNLQQLGSYMAQLENAPESIVELFSNFTYHVIYDLSNHNNLSPVTVPLEARIGTKLD